MVKAHCVVITDVNFIVVCERIMELQPGKKMNLVMMIMMNKSDLGSGWCQSLMLF